MTSTPRTYFEEIYREEADPWDFESSPYEQRKYDVTIASLPRFRYRSAYEPGCSIGILTELLAPRCDRLLSTDIVPCAVARAQRRLRGAPHVRIQESSIPDQWPAGLFDLVVLSEIAYYFDVTDLSSVIARIMESTILGAHIVGVHWRGETNYPLTAERSHRIIGDTFGLDTVVHHTEREFVLDIWEKR